MRHANFTLKFTFFNLRRRCDWVVYRAYILRDFAFFSENVFIYFHILFNNISFFAFAILPNYHYYLIFFFIIIILRGFWLHLFIHSLVGWGHLRGCRLDIFYYFISFYLFLFIIIIGWTLLGIRWGKYQYFIIFFFFLSFFLCVCELARKCTPSIFL